VPGSSRPGDREHPGGRGRRSVQSPWGRCPTGHLKKERLRAWRHLVVGPSVARKLDAAPPTYCPAKVRAGEVISWSAVHVKLPSGTVPINSLTLREAVAERREMVKATEAILAGCGFVPKPCSSFDRVP